MEVDDFVDPQSFKAEMSECCDALSREIAELQKGLTTSSRGGWQTIHRILMIEIYLMRLESMVASQNYQTNNSMLQLYRELVSAYRDTRRAVGLLDNT